MSSTRPTILIGLDAMEFSVAEPLLAAGKLPNLRSLLRSSCFARIESSVGGLLPIPWPTFISGTDLAQHGWYYGKMWRPEKMRLEHADDSWLPVRPFWTAIAGGGGPIALVDIPFARKPADDFDGAFIGGWQGNDHFERHCHPKTLRNELIGRFGRPALRPELYGPQNQSSLLTAKRQIIDGTRQLARICEWLLSAGPFELFAVVFRGTHRAGHYLWDLSQVAPARLDPASRQELESALHDVYIECDRAVGELLEKVTPGSRVMVFSLYGMGPNDGWSEVFPQMISAMKRESDSPSRPGFTYRLKKRLPWPLVRQVTTRLPAEFMKKLVPLWSSRMQDWSQTKFFVVPTEVNGLVRLNVQGREAQGVVCGSEESQALCREIADTLLSFTDIDTGAPIADAVSLVDDLVPSDAPGRRYLPDLLIFA